MLSFAYLLIVKLNTFRGCASTRVGLHLDRHTHMRAGSTDNAVYPPKPKVANNNANTRTRICALQLCVCVCVSVCT